MNPSTPLLAVLGSVVSIASAVAQDPTAPPVADSTVRSNLLNPSVTVFGNFVGRLDDRTVLNDEGDPIDDRFNLREVEVDFRAPIDPFTDAVLVLTAESEAPGEFEVGVEEGYIHLKSLPGIERMPAGLRFKIGRFRPSLGQYNRLHTHDLPHTTRPLSLQTFLGEEGFFQNGVSGTIDLPSFGESSVFTLEAAVLNGGEIAVGEDNGGEDPAFLARLGGYVELDDDGTSDLDFGFSMHQGRRNVEGTLDSRLYVADMTYRWSPSQGAEARSIVVGGEAYFAELDEDAGGDSSPWGGFAYAQYQLDERWYAGVRYDYTEALDDETSETRSFSAFMSYYTTEFLRLRAGWERFESDDPDRDGLDTFWVECNFVFGAHPPHPYWVFR